MPKKHQPNYSKISTSRPHSTTKSSTTGKSASPRSVNDRINQLRREQTPQATKERRDEITTSLTQRTVPPALRRILNIPETEGPPPRTRQPRARRIPGPAPPQSWLDASRHAGLGHIARDRDNLYDRSRDRDFGTLSLLEDNNVTIPNTSSLLHLTLKTLAKSWQSLIEIEQYYIPSIPNTRLKSLVVAYLGAFGGDGVLDIGGLKLLFAGEDDVAGGTGGDDLQTMDLSNLLSERLSLSDLNRFFSLKPEDVEARLQRLSISSDEQEPRRSPAESWEVEAEGLQLETSLSTTRFTQLTRLSLFNPGQQASWPNLLKIAQHLSTVTHLSLGYWPAPSATPNAVTTSMVSNHGRPVNLGGTNFHSMLDNDWYEAANILRRFSKKTYCLRWLDLEGCDWAAALAYGAHSSIISRDRAINRPDHSAFGSYFDDDIEENTDVGPDWNGVWRQIEYVNLSQGWIPQNVNAIRQLPAGLLGIELLSYIRERAENDELVSAPIHATERNIRYWLEREKEARRAGQGIRALRATAQGRYCRVDHGWTAPVGTNRASREE